MFAFGLCVLELATTKKLDHTAQQNWAEVVEMVQDKETKTFIERCVKPCAQCLSETILSVAKQFHETVSRQSTFHKPGSHSTEP